MRLSPSVVVVVPSFDGSETFIKINIIGFALRPTNVFFPPGTPVFPFIP